MFEQVKDALVESLNIDGEEIKLESNLKDDLAYFSKEEHVWILKKLNQL